MNPVLGKRLKLNLPRRRRVVRETEEDKMESTSSTVTGHKEKKPKWSLPRPISSETRAEARVMVGTRKLTGHQKAQMGFKIFSKLKLHFKHG